MKAQPTLEELLEEERAIVLERFDYDVAWKLGSAIREKAARERSPIAVEVTHGLDRVFFALLPGATPDNFDWTHRKAAVAHRFHHSSLYMRIAAQEGKFDFNVRYRLPTADYAASGGGVPLFVKNAGLVGVAAVSGLPDVEDHAIIVGEIKALMGAR
jgi:uncharacterized protein (UPF0303 family)